MKFSENWLRELVTIDADRASLVHALTMSGLEVEEVTPLGEDLDGVVVAEIVEAVKHPEADRLQVCKVDAGQGTLLQIVCGAPNARVGIRVPLAMVGATLPGNVPIKAAKLRGVESSGMLCSAKELGIDADASGLLELPSDAPIGKPLAEYLGLPDASIELKITPNRPDVLGLQGLAHDVAALFGSHVKAIGGTDVPVTASTTRPVRLEAGADAPRYLGRVIEGVNAAASSPLWLAERLRRSGIRPISAIVDVTQYVMLELGHPLHAFDNDTLSGSIIVRHAGEGEPLKRRDGWLRFARHRHHAEHLPRGRALRAVRDHGPRTQARPAYGCLTSLRAWRRSRAAEAGDGARDGTAAGHRGRQGRAGNGRRAPGRSP